MAGDRRTEPKGTHERISEAGSLVRSLRSDAGPDELTDIIVPLVCLDVTPRRLEEPRKRCSDPLRSKPANDGPRTADADEVVVQQHRTFPDSTTCTRTLWMKLGEDTLCRFKLLDEVEREMLDGSPLQRQPSNRVAVLLYRACVRTAALTESPKVSFRVFQVLVY